MLWTSITTAFSGSAAVIDACDGCIVNEPHEQPQRRSRKRSRQPRLPPTCKLLRSSGCVNRRRAHLKTISCSQSLDIKLVGAFCTIRGFDSCSGMPTFYKIWVRFD